MSNFFKTPSGQKINRKENELETWLQIAKHSGENGWFEYWIDGRSESTHLAFILDHVLLAYYDYFGWSNSGPQPIPCSSKEEVERYLKLQAFQ